MDVDIQTRDLTISGQAQKIIDRKIKKLEERLHRYHPESSHLNIKFSRLKKKNVYQCTLELKVLHKILVVKKAHADFMTAFSGAYDALVREFDKYRLKMNKSLKSKKGMRRKVLAVVDQEAAAWKEIMRAVIKNRIKILYRIARHEILNEQLLGELEPGELLPEDVVDEAILRVYNNFGHTHDQKVLEQELIKQVMNVSREFANERKAMREKYVSLEAPIEDSPEEEEVSTLGEEILYFFEPDEALRLEDVFEDPTAITPEEVVENEELQKLLYHFLSELPKDARQAFTLVHIEGFSVDEASMLLDRTPDQINRLIGEAEEYLTEKFRKEQTTIPRDQLRRVYQRIRSLPYRISVEERIASFEKMLTVTE